jgi:3-hydroxyisobutyrate dehydrogenase
MSCNVAFIGLGVMGYPMAGYISKAGHNVTVYNRTAAKADKWIAEYKGSKADTPAKAAEGADFIFTCVGNDNDLREVSLGENGLFNTAKKVLFILITLQYQQKYQESFIRLQKIKDLIF